MIDAEVKIMPTPLDVPVSVHAAVNVPLAAALPVFIKVVRDLGSQHGQCTDLSVNLARDLQMPIEAALHVQVRVHESDRGDHRFDLTMTPAVRHDYYPHFHGLLALTEAAQGACTVT